MSVPDIAEEFCVLKPFNTRADYNSTFAFTSYLHRDSRLARGERLGLLKSFLGIHTILHSRSCPDPQKSVRGFQSPLVAYHSPHLPSKILATLLFARNCNIKQLSLTAFHNTLGHGFPTEQSQIMLSSANGAFPES